ncbi:hypothetical protein CQA57_08090, partial [Helicobacter anseris]
TNTFNVNATTTTFKYGNGDSNNNDGLVFSNGTNNINFTNTSGATLNWRSNASNSDVKNTSNSDIKTTGGITNINFNHNGTLASGINTSNSGVTNITISDSKNATITGAIQTNTTQGNVILASLNPLAEVKSSTAETNIIFNGSNASLSLRDNATINSLNAKGENNTLNLSDQTRNNGQITPRESFHTLEITNLDKDSKAINFIVYVNPNATNNKSTTNKSDRIIIEESTGNSESSTTNQTHYLGVAGNANDIIGKVSYEKGSANNIALATIKDSSNITLQATDSISGFSLISYTFATDATDQNGSTSTSSGNGYTTYFLGSAVSKGATTATQQASAAALGSNYDLYLANMNSLNKRMGELRENANSQGAWARIFNGMQT